ncbi:hypothetical protein FNV43_RR17515 [Rhamnella rubrinervis]|uniref:Uncharacterized protein n=1 Tax=Rhamnella rubrinervis TaxID=2594499 RepID=A0A8K0GXW3_9ROSA|nr:hypothetical protein FNV43_RR17515 [Rhamnella rubrinervis]
MVVENVEKVAEIVETVAETVEEVADDIADQLPQDGKLHDAVRVVESIAKQSAIDAHLVDDLIEKVEEMEEKVENLLEPVLQDQEAKKVEHEPINADK